MDSVESGDQNHLLVLVLLPILPSICLAIPLLQGEDHGR
jgi:hypothetical protein